MPKFSLTGAQTSDIATFIHSFGINSRDPARKKPPSIVVGDAKAGAAYFSSKCASCHSASGDLAGIASKIPDARTLQQTWLMPRVPGGRGGGQEQSPTKVPPVTVTVVSKSGSKVEGRLIRIDDFLVTLADQAGAVRTFRLSEVQAEVHDPLKPHRSLLPVYTDKDIHDVTAFLGDLKMTRVQSCFAALCLFRSLAGAQGVEPSDLLKPLGDSWLSYSGDYSGKRYSSLKQVNQSNVKNLTLAWTSRVTAGSANNPAGPGGVAPALIVAGVGTAEAAGVASIKASILQVEGIIYVSTPDNAWAIDARDGHEIWHYVWKTRGGTHIGNRGLGMWHNRLYMETPDDCPGLPRRQDRQGNLA